MQWQGLIPHAAERSQKQAKQMKVFREDANSHIFQRGPVPKCILCIAYRLNDSHIQVCFSNDVAYKMQLHLEALLNFLCFSASQVVMMGSHLI